MVRHHYPKGRRYSALEKNILKYRAFEMLLILFRVQQLRGLILESVRATDKFRVTLQGAPPRLPDGIKRPDRKALEILVEDGIISAEEGAELRALVDYRNLVAHATERLTVDMNRAWSFSLPGAAAYQPHALERLRALSEKIHEGMRSQYVLSLSLDDAMFESAERAYTEEMDRLQRRIKKQMASMREEIKKVNEQIRSLPNHLLERLKPGHPTHFTRSGTLSPRGVSCCYSLFDAGARPLTVAYLMRISWRAAKIRFRRWTGSASSGD